MSSRVALTVLLAALACLLLATAIPGIYIVDENNYLATIVGLRDGSLKLQSTAGLSPSRELLSFDAAPLLRHVDATPVGPNVPPLYAVIALPFSWLGVRGLIALQVISFVVCALLVFGFTRRETDRTDLAWLATGTFVLATFSIEYAQGLWPHMLSVALIMGAVDCTSRIRAGSSAAFVLAATAGLCVGLATGIRYQNIVIAAIVGVSLVPSRRRAPVLLLFALGCALPLVTTSAMNAKRLGSWNPLSKGPTYLSIGQRSTSERVHQAFTSTWARVVDYSSWEIGTRESGVVERDQRTGAITVVNGGLKKALVQSSPWAVLPLFALIAVWRRSRERPLERDRRELRALSLIVASVIGVFAFFGFRHDGSSFNQRYFLELMPLLSISMALSLTLRPLAWRLLLAGGVVGVLFGALVTRLDPEEAMRQIFLMQAPIMLSGALCAAWALRKRAAHVYGAVFSIVLGACLGWAFSVHLGDDVRASRALRERNLATLEVFRAAIPSDRPAAVFASWDTRDAYGPLLLERDLVIVDPWIDGGKDARILLDQLLAAGRRTYAHLPMASTIYEPLTAGKQVLPILGAPLVEIR